jgi:hypothetical protein
MNDWKRLGIRSLTGKRIKAALDEASAYKKAMFELKLDVGSPVDLGETSVLPGARAGHPGPNAVSQHCVR